MSIENPDVPEPKEFLITTKVHGYLAEDGKTYYVGNAYLSGNIPVDWEGIVKDTDSPQPVDEDPEMPITPEEAVMETAGLIIQESFKLIHHFKELINGK